MKPSSNTADMTKGSPVRLILTFSIPLIIGNIFQQLYNMVDTVVVGNFVGSNAWCCRCLWLNKLAVFLTFIWSCPWNRYNCLTKLRCQTIRSGSRNYCKLILCINFYCCCGKRCVLSDCSCRTSPIKDSRGYHR